MGCRFLLLGFMALAAAASATPQEDLSRRLAGPWGRVDTEWRPYTGALSRLSCPQSGISGRRSIGLTGEGGSYWIEPGYGGGIDIYEGGSLPRRLTFVRFEDTGAVYREYGGELKLTLLGGGQLSEQRLPASPGMPPTNYLRCRSKS